MLAVHYDLWRRCQAFVSEACVDRDASHGLAHMQRVTETAVALCLMDSSLVEDAQRRFVVVYGVILVGMLHDVADHKYDADGALRSRLYGFIVEEVKVWLEVPLLSSSSTLNTLSLPCDLAAGKDGGSVADALTNLLLVCIEAISYSTEVRKGMRWFEAVLPAHFVQMRDYVSDADKLEAIGSTGLLRCYEYTCHCLTTQLHSSATGNGNGNSLPASRQTNDVWTSNQLRAAALGEVEHHYKEKLEHLASRFIVTDAGRFLAESRQTAMAQLLVEWRHTGPPCVCDAVKIADE